MISFFEKRCTYICNHISMKVYFCASYVCVWEGCGSSTVIEESVFVKF